ncbi:MAG: hypothetical protein M1833_000416 [Piccolia ochrophora]|nr:MAG: hypothetical protein M1833_000416 [Piccolia ochrophora]
MHWRIATETVDDYRVTTQNSIELSGDADMYQPGGDAHDNIGARPPQSAQYDPLAFQTTFNDDFDIDEAHYAPIPSGAPKDAIQADVEFETEDDFEDFGEQIEPHDRPNRFRGAPSTWLTWNEQERLVFNALEQERAEDLAVHLYNAHALKARLRDPARVANAPTWGTKSRWTRELGDDESGQEEGAGFYPPKSWTAWPMTPDVVPRPGERQGWEGKDGMDSWRARKQDKGYASRELEELLVAEMLRRAREKLEERGWESESEVVNEDSTAKDASPSPPASEQDLESPAPKQGSPAIREDSLREHEADKSTSRHPHQITATSFKPVPLADDGLAHDLLRPTARHILSNLDTLLEGLHHARASYATHPTASSPSDDASLPTTTTTHSRSTSHSRSHSRSRSRARKRSLSSPPPTTRPGRQLSTPAARRSRLHPRDWSDILATASHTQAFSASAISRTATRCAALFNESITFRTLHASAAKSPVLTTYTPTPIPAFPSPTQPSTSTTTTITPNITSTTAADPAIPHPPPLVHRRSYTATPTGPTPLREEFFCPLAQCPRRARGFSRRWNRREHMRRMHPGVNPNFDVGLGRVGAGAEGLGESSGAEVEMERGRESAVERDGDGYKEEGRGRKGKGKGKGKAREESDGEEDTGYLATIKPRRGWKGVHVGKDRARKGVRAVASDVEMEMDTDSGGDEEDDNEIEEN